MAVGQAVAQLKVHSTTGRSTGTLSSSGPIAPEQLPEELKLERHIGAGHSGEVLLARSSAGDALVLKVARRDEPSARMKKLSREFQQEHKTGLELQKIHPAFVRTLVAGELKMGSARLPAALMEKVEGEALASRKASSRPRPPEVALGLMIKLAEILSALEAAGYRHNDLHTENLLCINDDPRALRIIDLGRVSRLDAPTKASRIVFAAPERRTGGGTTGVASDIYAAGVVLFTLLNGGPPRLKKKGEGVDEGQLARALDRAGLKGGPREALAGVLRTALATRPEDRFSGFAELQRALKEALSALPRG